MQIEEGINYADELDRAAHLTDVANQSGVSAVRARLKPEQIKNKDGTWPITECVICDTPIPAGRLEATGSTHCTYCQDKKERRGNLQ